jgi:GNAT superfamily N-acetyltransferase
MPLLFGVAVGAFSDPYFATPEQAVWAADKHHWVSFPDDMPLHERNPPPKGARSQEDLKRKESAGGSPCPNDAQILPYEPRHFAGVDALWKSLFPDDPPRNSAETSVTDKMKFQPGLLFIAETGGTVVGTAMAGYDGHRGWLYAIAVHPEQQRKGIGAMLVLHAEAALGKLGCRKVNLQMRAENRQASAFYHRLGYAAEDRISMGKLLSPSST